MDKATTIKEVNQVFIDQGTAVAIIVILVTLLTTYFGVKIWMQKKEASQKQKWKDEDRAQKQKWKNEDRAYDRKQKEEERKAKLERELKIYEAQERNTEALKDLIKQGTKAVESNNYSIQRFEDKLQVHTDNANVNLAEVSGSIKELNRLMQIAISTQDDLAKTQMLIELNNKMEKYFAELKKDMGTSKN